MTSPTEASHQQLKTYLVNGTSHLYWIHSVILVMLDSKADNFKKKVETQKVQLQNDFRGTSFSWLGDTNHQVSWKVVDKINQQLLLVKASKMPGSLPLGVCTDRFMRQWGIPCSHSLSRWVKITGTKIQILEALEKTDFNQFWWLDSSLDEDLPILRL